MLRDEIQEFLGPLIDAAQHPVGVQLLFQSLGRSDELGNSSALSAEIQRLAALARDLTALDDETLDSWVGLAKVLALSRDLLVATRALDQVLSDPTLVEQAQDLGVDLVQHLLSLYLRGRHQNIFRAASVLTLITPAELAVPLPLAMSGTKVVRYPRHVDQFHVERIEDLIKQPLQTLSTNYFPNDLATAADAHEAGRRLFPVLSLLADALGLPSFSDTVRAIPEPPTPPPTEINDSDHFTGSEADENEDPVEQISPEPIDLTVFFETYLPRFVFVLPGLVTNNVPVPARFAISVLVSSPRHPGGACGLVITPLGQLDWSEERDGWKLTAEASGQVPAFVLGPGGVSKGPLDSSLTTASAGFSVERVAQDSAPAFVLGAAKGTRLEIGALRFSTDVRVAPTGSEVVLAADAKSGAIVLAPGDADSFLRSVLPDKGVRCQFNLGIELSSEHGLRLRGSAGLDATLPIGLSIGPVKVPTIHLGLHASEAGLQTEVSASIELSIGPVYASVERIGLTSELTFPEEGADFALDFKPPNGIGLLIEAAGVSGGGYLFLDFAKGEYAGVVQLNIHDSLTVTAIGVITTKLPDGSKGFSFVVLITAEGFTPIQLGLGFTLTGIGGLLAINRTCNEEFLRDGIQKNTLGDLLFPKDPIRNAVQIFGTLNNAFPPKMGSYLFGPVVQICWGTPPLITMNLGLILELGNRTRLIILGLVKAILPTEKHDLIRLQMNALGVIDFDRGSISLDAVLYDSRLVGKFPITGGMAMRLRWGSDPTFALSIGGFHPAFKPPANFPSLERLAISFSNSDNFKLRAETYIAITSNTLQLGAKLEMLAKAGGFSIEGRLGFDVLIQFDPFLFLADFYASVQLKRGSHNLFKVKVEGQLSGPRPLHIKGKATFEIFWCDFSVGFDKTLVEGEAPPQLEPVQVMVLLKAALNDARNWSGQLAEGQRRLVSLRDSPAADRIPLHPLGQLAVKQNIVPLELEISKFGNAAPADAHLFKINGLTVNGKDTGFSRVKDFFPPSQFLELSDDEKLAAPSFELMMAGLAVGADSFMFTTNPDDLLEDDAMTFETIILDKENNNSRPAPPISISPQLLTRALSFGAAARSPILRTGAARYRPAIRKNSVVKKGWSIASTTDGTSQDAPGLAAGEPVSYAESFQTLQKLKQENPARSKTMMLVRVEIKN